MTGTGGRMGGQYIAVFVADGKPCCQQALIGHTQPHPCSGAVSRNAEPIPVHVRRGGQVAGGRGVVVAALRGMVQPGSSA